jgi:hypothetical protein
LSPVLVASTGQQHSRCKLPQESAVLSDLFVYCSLFCLARLPVLTLKRLALSIYLIYLSH